ncbi:NACHT domain-containing protein [Luteimonas sp. 3794]|uniref:NACHT domain-containing protein n=1 Tax=Luteimonas sp. 3794 TaxID=2817730 RepID=UPI002864CE11|nr:NACHT domain-containing protein [Luteimonas sp. 3794]MDR6990652.1 ABC-type Fe3+/spermidine/putrescine transport system ATPase subunit [Luteimonas sp. 3794]
MFITQTEKEKFLAELSEDNFRDQIVRRLFKALGFRDGRDLCGPEEFGKDAIFVDTDRFGDESFVAVQTKVGSITMAGDPSKNLHIILAQVRTALDHPYICVRSKNRKLPSVVYLAASGTINANARGYIQHEISDPRLKFLDRDDLIAKVDEHCPEIWSGIVAEVSPYLKSLSDRVDDLSISIQDINNAQSSLGAFAAASDRAFVDPLLGYQELAIEKREGKITEDFRFVEVRGSQLFRNDGVRALVLGEAGSGKTTLMIRLAYLLAKNSSLSRKTYRVPVFVRAFELVGQTGDAFSTLSSLVLKNHALRALPFSLEDFEAGRIVLLVDALDELAESHDRQTVIDFCLKFVDAYPKCSMALTTRPYSSVDRLAGLNRFKRFRISSLSMEDASKMLANMDTQKGVAAAADWRRETLRKLQGIHGVELNPLLVTVFAASTKIDKKDVPANITELFSKFSELMLGRWDEKKGLDQQYQAKVKEALLSEFAFELHNRGESSFQRSEFVAFASRRLHEINLTADVDILVDELLDRSGLVRGDEEMEFRHHLLQEYFAAKGMPDIEFVRSVLADDWWRNSVVFYFGENPRNVDQLLDVATSNVGRASDSFIAVGLALQACYLSKIDDRVDVWKWVNGAAAESLVELQLVAQDDKYPLTYFLEGYLEARDALALSGIEDSCHQLGKWCASYEDAKIAERHAFWYAVGLSELGEFSLIGSVIEAVKDPVLLTAIHFGLFFAHDMKALTSDQKKQVDALMKKLDPVVAAHRFRITEEFRGQLLEYRRGGVVALDQVEPARNS